MISFIMHVIYGNIIRTSQPDIYLYSHFESDYTDNVRVRVTGVGIKRIVILAEKLLYLIEWSMRYLAVVT